MKTLYLHVGFPKTGSSFLQVVFARNAAFLRDTFGLDYLQPDPHAAAHAAEGRITSGNGQWLVGQVLNGADVGSFLDPYLCGPSGKSLISTENWSKLPADAQAAVKEHAAAHGFEVRAVAFVRDPFELAISSYLQGVKRGLAFKPLEASTKNFTYHHAKFATEIRAHYPLDLVEYDANRDRLVEAFFDCLGLDGSLVPDIPADTVNRSISAEECAYLLRLNARHQDNEFARYISDYLVERFPFSGTPITHSRQSFAHVAAALGVDPDAEAKRRGFKPQARILDPEVMAETAFRVQEALCDLAVETKAENEALKQRLRRRRGRVSRRAAMTVADLSGSGTDEQDTQLALQAAGQSNIQLRARMRCVDALSGPGRSIRMDKVLDACKAFAVPGDFCDLVAFLEARGERVAALAVCDLADSKGLTNAELLQCRKRLEDGSLRGKFLSRLRRR